MNTVEPQAADPLIGRIFKGAYQIESLIGEGGMGSVYRARQLVVGREVAVKVLRPHMVLNERTRKNLVKRFEREARATSVLNHPNTVRLFDFGETQDGTLFLALELLQGAVLSEVITHEGTLAPARVAAIAQQVCRSLAEAHGAGIIHRDLKPDNVFLCVFDDQEDFVKVVDFGIARVVEESGTSSVTATGATVGTPAYMAPEQAMANADAICPATDLYSLGIMIYEMLTGAPPFQGDTFMQVALQHIQSEPKPLDAVLTERGIIFNPDIVAAWQALLNALLAKDPQERPQSAREVADTLKTLERSSAEARIRTQPDDKSLSHLVSRAAVVSALDRTQNGVRVASAPEITMGEQPGVRPAAGRRARAPLVAAAAAVLLAAGIGAFAASQGGAPPAAPKLDAPKALAAATAAREASPPGGEPGEPGEPGERPGAAAVAKGPVGQAPHSLDPSGPPDPSDPTRPTRGAPDIAATTPPERAPGAPAAGDGPGGPSAARAAAAVAEAPAKARLVLTTTPPGAAVTRGEAELCTTPCDLDVDPGDGAEPLGLALEGYEPGEATVTLTAGARSEHQVALTALASRTAKKRRRTHRVTKAKSPATVTAAPSAPKKPTPVKATAPEPTRTKRKLLKFSTADPTGK